MGKDVIVACDFSSAEATFAFLDKFTGRKPFVKIGMELYYAEGPAIVREIIARGHKIFLDLKLHDIPNTVKKAMAVLAGLGVDMTNLHAAGGIERKARAPDRRGRDRVAQAAAQAHRLDLGLRRGPGTQVAISTLPGSSTRGSMTVASSNESGAP